MATYHEYPNALPGCYTVHVDVSAADDKAALELERAIRVLLNDNGITVSDTSLTDTDDWAEHIHYDDHPNAVRVGVGRRIVIDDNGHLVP